VFGRDRPQVAAPTVAAAHAIFRPPNNGILLDCCYFWG
jgi:hypothetical protein